MTDQPQRLWIWMDLDSSLLDLSLEPILTINNNNKKYLETNALNKTWGHVVIIWSEWKLTKPKYIGLRLSCL